jgi:MerR family transcriptional regulator/heat shock protein HspR
MSDAPEVIPREQAARHLAVAVRHLTVYERRGLIHVARVGSVEGYTPDQVRRLWTIVTLQRDLGVNLAGVEAILSLNQHLNSLHARLARIADQTRRVLEDDADADAPAP